MAKGWMIDGVNERTRSAVMTAAQEAGLPVGAWVEQALQKALDEGLEAGVSIEEIEARVRAAVAEELRPVQQTLARLEAMGSSAPSPADGGSPVNLVRERMRQRRGR